MHATSSTVQDLRETQAWDDAAALLGQQGMSCSEAVFVALNARLRLGMDPSLAIRAAGGFAGGMALTGGPCGAVSGGVMALGLALGSDQAGDRLARERMFMAVQELAELFSAEHGSLLCKELCPGVKFGDPESAAKLRQSGRPELLIRTAARLVREIVREYEADG